MEQDSSTELHLSRIREVKDLATALTDDVRDVVKEEVILENHHHQHHHHQVNQLANWLALAARVVLVRSLVPIRFVGSFVPSLVRWFLRMPAQPTRSSRTRCLCMCVCACGPLSVCACVLVSVAWWWGCESYWTQGKGGGGKAKAAQQKCARC